MGKIYEKISGIVRVEVTGVFPETVLNASTLNAIELWELDHVDAYTVRMTLFEKQLAAFCSLCEKSMCEISVLNQTGGSKNRRFLRRRAWLLLSAVLAALLLFVSSLFIWEIDVRGCDKLTEGQILRALEDCGVGRGTYWPGLSADLVRSQMLRELPDLAWMTVNVNGSRAIVLVSERKAKPEIYVESRASDLIAGKTGIITKMSVLNGKPMVCPGQSVVEGELLVSGTVDSLSNAPRQIRAQAEVLADTWYELTAVCPLVTDQKTELRCSFSRFALKIGKNRLNFYWSGGKDIDECDKIIYEYNWGIDGLFALPVTLVREKLSRWKTTREESGREQEMKERLYASLAERIDGQIVSSSFSVSRSEELLCVTLRAHCQENIARIAEYPGES